MCLRLGHGHSWANPSLQQLDPRATVTRRGPVQDCCASWLARKVGDFTSSASSYVDIREGHCSCKSLGTFVGSTDGEVNFPIVLGIQHIQNLGCEQREWAEGWGLGIRVEG